MKSKTKIMTIAAATLACVAVAGVGFASWVITGSQQGTVGGNVNVEEVVNNYKTVAVTTIDTGLSFTASAKDQDVTYDWLQATDTEDLVIQFKLDPSDNATTVSMEFFAADIVLDETTNKYVVSEAQDAKNFTDEWAAVVSAKYIKDFAEAKIEYTDAETIDNSTVWETATGTTITFPTTTTGQGAEAVTTPDTITVRITFAWGDKFGGKNPINHYNKEPITSALATEAETALNAIYALKDAVYNIVCTPA